MRRSWSENSIAAPQAPEKFLQTGGFKHSIWHDGAISNTKRQARLIKRPKAGKSHVEAFPSVLIACRSLHQNAGWEEEEPGAGNTGSAWSGAHGSLVEYLRKPFPNGETPSPTSRSLNVKSWRIHGEILSLSIAYPDCTLTPI